MNRATVPCNGCTACCRYDLIMLDPEHGDRAELYLTEPARNPITGELGLALQQKRDGGCVYLGEHGCTIHDRAPAICREFDCRKFYRDSYMARPRPERRRLLRNHLIGKAVLEAGRSRLHTLDEPAR